MRPNCAKILAFVFIANILLVEPNALAARFVDLSGSWAEKYINQLSDDGVIAAEDTGKFRPSDPVTRAQLAVWLAKVLGIDNQPVSDTPSFPDVKPSDWFYRPVEIIRQNNYISGYADGFRPNQFIQKGEVISIIARTLGTSVPDEATISDQLSKFSDGSKVPDWAKSGVAQAAQAGILANNQDPNVIAASSIASRADTAALLYNLSQYLTKQHIAESTASSNNNNQIAASSASPNYNNQVTAATAPPNYTPYNAPDQTQAQSQSSYSSPNSYPPPQALNAQQSNYQAQTGYNSPPTYQQPGNYGTPNNSPPTGYAPNYAPYSQGQGNAPPPNGNYYQGQVSVVAAGTRFPASLINTLDSGSSQPGEEVRATLSQPLYSGGMEVVPAGSHLVGQVTNVISAKRFHFGANGKIDIRFTALETPDGRRFPLSASIDSNQLRLSGGTTAGRWGKGLLTTGAGALGGAALGTGLGAIVGATSHGRVGMATGMGAVFGTAIGAGVGGVGAVVRKGSEVKIIAGTQLPVQLDDSFQVTPTPPSQPAYGGGYTPPPNQQPPVYYPPQ